MYKYACEFTIRGMGQPPLDMMRYDRCTPATQQDVGNVTAAGGGLGEVYSVRMLRFTEGNGRNHADHPTVDRWQSFGWQVSDVTWRKLA